MKIIRHTARDMRQALRAVREQLGEDAVILSSRRTGEGVEVTAAVDFDASTLEAGGFSNPPAAAPLPARALPPPIIEATAVAVAPAAASTRVARSAALPAATHGPAASSAATRASTAAAPNVSRSPAASSSRASRSAAAADEPAVRSSAAQSAAATRVVQGAAAPRSASTLSATAFALTTGRAPPMPAPAGVPASPMDSDAETEVADEGPAPSYDELAALEQPDDYDDEVTFTSHASPRRAATVTSKRGAAYAPAYDADLISEAAREAVVEHLASERAPVLAPAPAAQTVDAETTGSYEDRAARDPVEEIREATLTPLASSEIKATFAELAAGAAANVSPAAEAMGNELKTLRRMLENQLAHLAWNDLTRRAPVHAEILRELTEIGISQDLAEHLVRQLPEDQDLTFARRFTIAGLSQYLKVTGDHWLDDGGRVAFVGATGVGKTTTLAKIAVRWVLRHGPREIALVAADPVRIGAQDQLRSLAQLLGVSVYTPESFDHLPELLSRLSERLILIDTPGSSVRDSQLAGRLAVLSNSASKLETALVLAASTQAGAIEEAVRRFAPANPSCCVLTKLDEAASLGGVLSALIRARLPVSYMSEGQRVPEDLRPARALELVSAAVRLAKARGAAADEDLLRRRFGKNAHGIS